MSTTDQAFIRAYDDQPQSQVEPQQDADPAVTPTRFDTAVEFVSPVPVPASAQISSESGLHAAPFPQTAHAPPVKPAAKKRFRLDQQHGELSDRGAPTLYGPHISLGRQVWTSPDEASVDDSATSTPEYVFQSRHRPHSAHFAGRHDAESQSRPGTTVAAFRFPAACQQLLNCCSDELDCAIEEILTSEQAGRSLIGIAACQSRAGCTTVLLCLAQRLLSIGKSVAVADANFAHPAVANWLGISCTTAWQDVLQHSRPVADALVHSQSDGLTVLPSSHLSPGNVEGGVRLQASVTAGVLRYGYDVALIDLGAVSEPRHSENLMQLAAAMRIDAGLLVTDASRSKRADVEAAQQVLSHSHARILGIIENFVDAVPQSASLHHSALLASA